ncbi:MAG: hypothetical protein ABIQ16_00515 [Polyangiaceae bacterium]
MGMFTRLFGGEAGRVERIALAARAANLTAPNPGEPALAEVIPGQVDVEFYLNDSIDEVLGSFLTAVSVGLALSGQRELVLSMRLGTNESPIAKMQDIVRFLQTVHAWAQAGQFLDQGGLTQFGERGLFGSTNSGLLYADARPVLGVTLPKRALAAIFVEAQEVRAALEYGTYRVLTRIGMQLRIFPFPTWGALDRPSAMTKRESQTFLAKLPRMKAPGVTFLMSANCLRITLPSDDSLSKGLAALPQKTSFALLTRPAQGANAILVWKPGQDEMSGISPDGSDGSRVSGSCLMFATGSTVDEARWIEDGYSLLLTHESWASFSAAILARRALSLPLANEMSLELALP